MSNAELEIGREYFVVSLIEIVFGAKLAQIDFVSFLNFVETPTIQLAHFNYTRDSR